MVDKDPKYYPKTDQEKIDLVKDLLRSACEALNKQFDEMMDKIEKEWLEENEHKDIHSGTVGRPGEDGRGSSEV